MKLSRFEVVIKVVKQITISAMKKYIYFLLALPMLLFVSCSNDDDLPQVDTQVTYSGAVEVDGVLYVPEGQNFAIESITATPLKGYKEATIGATAYYWNYQYVGTTIEAPFGLSFNTAAMPVGDYMLQINATIYQVDRSVGIAYFTYPVKIVPVDEMPSGTTGGTDIPDTDVRAGVIPTV